MPTTDDTPDRQQDGRSAGARSPRSKGAALVRSDAIALPLRDDSVDLIVTSPPYFALRSYKDGGEHYWGQIGSEATPFDFLKALWAVTAECARVLKPTGSMFVNLGDKYVADNRGSGGDAKRGEAKHAPAGPAGFVGRDMARQKSLMGLPWRYALGCIDQLGLILRAEIVWAKPNGLPEPHRDRVSRTHEQWFHLTKEPTYFGDTGEIREPAVWGRQVNPEWAAARAETSERRGAGRNGLSSGFQNDTPAEGRLPGSVWTVALEPLRVPDWLGVDHFAAFPQEWPRRLILGFSPAGGVVLDPFGGTGTTAMVARYLGRFGVSNDLSADYLRLANWRVFESGHGQKAADRTMAEAQMSMLGGVA
jgi:DNA modification methylase